MTPKQSKLHFDSYLQMTHMKEDGNLREDYRKLHGGKRLPLNETEAVPLMPLEHIPIHES